MKYLIDDVRAGETANILDTFPETVQVRAEAMTESLLSWFGWEKLDVDRTLVVFPGNGSGVVRGYISPDWLSQWQWVTVPAKRVWNPGENPWVMATRIFPQTMMLGVRNVVLIDDVISSGQTMRKIRRINEPWIPNADWHAVAWMAQRSATLKGFKSVYAPVQTGSEKTKVPINSLSTLVSDSKIATNYATRNYSDPAKFLEALHSIKTATAGT